ncbi:IS110 family transposase [Thiohalocapsa sp.]|uniref:IS110 family transposase n=1 Tax=Thiohalocapsa sp. TaxID=2497641 RepID=UPI0025DED4D5|nr:IS110 family transposase [Thiohalocapsa sp.]
MKLYGGIDLHSNNNVVVLSDEEDKVVYRRRLPNDIGVVLAELAPFRDHVEGWVVESTYNWYWLVDGLMEAGYRVHLANTAAIVQYEGLKYADDESDARWLAKLLRLGLLPEGYIYPKEERAVRDLLRRRSRLVQQRTSNLLAIQNLLARNRGRSLSANAIKRLTYEEVDQLLPDADLALAVKGNLAVMRTQEGVIELLEKTVKARIKLRPGFKPLLSVSGIGEILGLTIMLETGEIERFAKVGNYASYCRCVGSEHLSNGKRKGRGNTKNGNKYLGWAYIEAANFAVRYNPRIKRYYQRKCGRSHPIVAIKAVAHKLARACYYILRDHVPFDVERAFT